MTLQDPEYHPVKPLLFEEFEPWLVWEPVPGLRAPLAAEELSSSWQALSLDFYTVLGSDLVRQIRCAFAISPCSCVLFSGRQCLRA